MKFIIGKKIDMTQVWSGEDVKAVTRVAVGPCRVVQVKTAAKDGYMAVQLGYGQRKEKNINKPQRNHQAGLGNLRYLREFNISRIKKSDSPVEVKRGDIIDVSTFAPGDKIQVTSTSKGKGFQGVVKRHGFHGHNTTHGTKDQVRHSGSIGAGGVQHVFKGVRMSGRMGGERVTVKNLHIIEVDAANNILLIEGAVPGARNGLVLIQGEGELKISAAPEEKKEEIKEETKKEEIKTEEPKVDKAENGESEETPEKVEKEVVEAKEKVDEKAENN